MAYTSLEDCLLDLEKHGMLVRVKEEVDPHLEMASIHLRVHAAKGPALLFENIKCPDRTKRLGFRAASNIFGTLERSRFLFRDTIDTVKALVELKSNPGKALKAPLRYIGPALASVNALPRKVHFSRPVLKNKIRISDLPLIKHWPNDGGAFVTLPQVYTEDIDAPGTMAANLGMYRIQLSGNEYVPDKEIGLHYQLHRGIGVHQTKANQRGQSLKVSCFVGGPPAHTLAAVMPLPEGMGELSFAGVLGNRRFRYCYVDGHAISTDADFVIVGTVAPGENKPEGPFGDHLGYYSLQHAFPLMKVEAVYAKEKAIWPFTVVGRPPQEDTSFGELIHEITGSAVSKEIPGLKEIHAVDASGVHPLLIAIGSERYTPYQALARPQEILTIANHILGTGQLSLAKFLFIASDEVGKLSTKDVAGFFRYMFERLDPTRDIHFHTNTSIDTLDYSGEGLNTGSKVVIAACGNPIRRLTSEAPGFLTSLRPLKSYKMAFPGILALEIGPFGSQAVADQSLSALCDLLQPYIYQLEGIAQIVVCDDCSMLSEKFANYLWVTHTRCNPSHDIYGVGSFTMHKHWGCTGPIIMDARIKPHHAPVLELDPAVERRVDRFFDKGKSLYGSQGRS